MLRMARLEDEDRIFELLTHFHQNTQYAGESMEESKVRPLIRTCMDPHVSTSTVILWEQDGQVVGLIAGQCTEVVFSSQKVATELVWWVEPEYRKTEASTRLLEAFEAWAAWSDCRQVQMYSLNNEYATVLSRYYSKQGYRLAELSYVKELW